MFSVQVNTIKLNYFAIQLSWFIVLISAVVRWVSVTTVMLE